MEATIPIKIGLYDSSVTIIDKGRYRLDVVCPIPYEPELVACDAVGALVNILDTKNGFTVVIQRQEKDIIDAIKEHVARLNKRGFDIEILWP